MVRYFAVNSMAGCYRTAAAIVEAATAGRFDATYVSNAISVPNVTDTASIKATASNPFLDGSTSITGTFYFRFDHYYAAGALPYWTLKNGGANAYRMNGPANNSFQMQYWNSVSAAWVNWGAAFSLSAATLRTHMLKITVGGGFEFYTGGALSANSATVPTNGPTAVDEFVLQSPQSAFFSQLMCADYDLRDSHMNSVLPTANGTYTDGTGAAGDVGEAVLDDGTAIGLPAVGNKHTFTKTAIPALPVGLVITSKIINARMRVGGGVVADGKLKIRSATTDSTTTGRAVASGYEPRRGEFPTDPATGTTWTKAGFDAAEVGAEAA